MSNMHRIMWLDHEIRMRKYPNCRTLAEHFEISLRQANRDVEYLKNTLNAPMRYIAAKRGFIYEDMTFVLPNLMITSDEMKVLSFLAHKYGNYDGTTNNQRISKLFKNLSEQTEPNGKIPFFALNREYLALFHELNECIKRSKKIFIMYIDSRNGLKKLLVHPYHIFGKMHNDFLTGYCEDYGDICTFRLERIVEIAKTDQQFIRRDDYRPEDYDSLLKKPFKALLEMENDNVLTFFMGNSVRQTGDKYFEIEFYDTEALIADLMASHMWKRIVSPSWLKEKIKKRCISIIKKIDAE